MSNTNYTIVQESNNEFDSPISTSTSQSITELEQYPLEAGKIIGIHNIYIVVPQFISTLVCLVIFYFLDDESYVFCFGGVAWIVAGIMALSVDESTI
jgi:hypothetical protein